MLRILGPAKAKELIFTGEMIAADEALKIGLVNKVVSLDTDSDALTRSSSEEDVPKLLNKKLINECIRLGEEITKNSRNAVRTSKLLINKGMETDLETGLHLEIYGWALCFAHEDRQKMMSAFLNKGRDKK